MQDKTINNALLALYRSGEGRGHVEALMAIRGVAKPKCVHDRQLSRGGCRRLVLANLPATASQIADVVQSELPGVTRKSAFQRVYMALRRLEDAGVVRCDRSIWRG